MIKGILIFLFGCFIGALILLGLIFIVLGEITDDTVTFQTDSVWFSECTGAGAGDFALIWGDADCDEGVIENG